MRYAFPLKESFIILSPGFAANEEDTTCLPPIQQYVLATRKLYPELQITIISFQYPFKRSTYTWNGVQVIALAGQNKPGIRRLFTWMRAWKTLNRVKKESRPIGILSLWLTECALVGKTFSTFYKLKHYIWVQGQDVKKSNQFIRRISPKPSEVIAISEFTQKELKKNFGIEPKHIVENGINPDSFPPLNTGKRDIDILCTGSLIHLKRYDRIVDIVRELKKEFPLLKVGIAGEGINETEIKTWCEKAGLNSTITFYGSIAHFEVFKLMNNSKVFLHTSDYEGNSTVLIEALYSGCEVFSTRELSSRNPESFHLLETNEQFLAAISEILRTEKSSKRILFNEMSSSAARIMQLYR